MDKPLIYRIDRMWADKYEQRYFYGPLFIRPCDIEHPPTRLFYKNEMFICGVEEARTMDSVTGRCCVLHVKDFCTSKIVVTIKKLQIEITYEILILNQFHTNKNPENTSMSKLDCTQTIG
jgi:hypothetical protein